MFLEYKDYKPELRNKTMELATEKWNERILHLHDLIVCWLGTSVGYIFFRVKFKLGTKFSTQVTSSREAITRITLNFGAALSNSDSNSDFGMDHSKYYFDRPMKFLITTPDGSYIRNLRTKLAIASKFCSHLNQSSGLHFKNTECNSSVPEHLTSCFGLPLPFKELRSQSLGVTKTKCRKISFYLQVDSVTPSARASNTVFIEGYYKYGIFLHYLGLTSTHQPCIMSFVDVKSLVQVSTTSLSLEIMLMQELLHFDGTETIVVLTSNLSYVKKFDQLNIEASMFAEGWKYNNDIKTQLPKPLATKSCGLFDEAQLCTTGCRVSTFNIRIAAGSKECTGDVHQRSPRFKGCSSTWVLVSAITLIYLHDSYVGVSVAQQEVSMEKLYLEFQAKKFSQTRWVLLKEGGVAVNPITPIYRPKA